MRTHKIIRFSCLRGSLALTALALVGPVSLSNGQTAESSPIEYSQPRDSAVGITNTQDLGSQKRRISDLENQISSEFDFFGAGSSVGPPAPMPLPMPRTVHLPRTKSSSLFEKEGDWVFTDPLKELLRSLGSEEDDLDGLGRRSNREEGQFGGDLLNVLRSKDWLVNATFGESDWDAQLAPVRNGYMDGVNPDTFGGDNLGFGTTERSEFGMNPLDFARSSESNRRSENQPFNDYFGQRDDSPSLLALREEADEAWDGEMRSPQDWSSSLRPVMDTRRQEYRELLGMKPETSVRPDPGLGNSLYSIDRGFAGLQQPTPLEPVERIETMPTFSSRFSTEPFPVPQPVLSPGVTGGSLQPILPESRSLLNLNPPPPPELPGTFRPFETPLAAPSPQAPPTVNSAVDYRIPSHPF